MLLVNRKIADVSDRPAASQVRLVAERRLFLKRRWRGTAEDGTEFGFDLESRLTSGCVIHRTEASDYVILQETELVYELRPATAAEAALMGWKIGNLHFPVEITEGRIRAMHDPAIRALCEREGWAFEEVRAEFHPLKAVPHAS